MMKAMSGLWRGKGVGALLVVGLMGGSGCGFFESRDSDQRAGQFGAQPPRSTASGSSTVDYTSTTYTDVFTMALDSFVITQSDADVLFAIDSSAGMGPSLSSLAADSPVFLDFYLGSGVDYHIGVVDLDLSDPNTAGILRTAQGVAWIDNTTPDVVSTLSQLLDVGALGAADQQGRNAVFVALELYGSSENAGFLRPGVPLHVVFISDGDDLSGNTLTGESEFASWLDEQALTRPQLSVSAIVSPGTGASYVGYASDFGGLIADLSVDWVPSLQQLGALTSGIQTSFELSDVPVAGTLEVNLESATGMRLLFYGADYSFDETENRVGLLFIPRAGDTVHASYEPAF